MRGHASTCVLVLVALITLPGASAMALSEPPDYSNNGAAPTSFNLVPGGNILSGAFGGGDVDIVRVNVPAGMSLTQITLDAYGAGDLSFVGVKIGSTWPGNPNIDGTHNGYTHISPGHIGTDILDDIAFNSGGALTPPLGGGDYTFWMQNASAGTTPFSMNFVVVPEPAAGIALLAVAGLTLSGRPRRR